MHHSLQILLSLFLVLFSMADEPRTSVAIKKSYKQGSATFISTEISTFVGLAYDSVMFVDKSLLIKEIMEADEKVFLITCPRRWGKSVNLNMLKVFLELRAKDRGEIIRLEKTFNYILFMKGEVWEPNREKQYLRGPLLIAQHPLFCEEHLGQYPMIYVEFDYTGLENTFSALVEGMRVAMANAYSQHKYLIHKFSYDIRVNDEISDEQKDVIRTRFNRYYDFIYYGDNLTPFDVLDGLLSLSELLHYFFHRKVIILIDEYHLFWEKIVMSNWTRHDEKRGFLEYYVKFMETTFTNNTYYAKGVITGVYPPPKEHYPGFFNQTVECNLWTGKLMEYYGFNQSVIQDFYDILNVPKNTREKVDRWYGGYTFDGGTLHLYNPYSMANFLSEDEFDKYWVKEMDLQLFIINCLQIDAFQHDIHQLLSGKVIKADIDHLNTTWSDIELVHNILRFYDEKLFFKGIAVRKLWTFLYIHGYISIKKSHAVKEQSKYSLKFPNDEIRLAVKRYVEEYYENVLSLDLMHPSLASNMRREFHKFIRDPDENHIGFQKALQTYLEQEKSVFGILSENDLTSDRIIFEMVTYLLIDDGTQLKGKIDHHVQYRKSDFPTAVVIFVDRVVIMNVKFDETSVDIVLNVCKAHPYPISAPVHGVNASVTKFIGINILANKTVDIAFDLK